MGFSSTMRLGGRFLRSVNEEVGVNTAKKEWAVGELEFEGLMRMLDNSGFRTGYTYIQPLERIEPARLANDVELPPTSSNLGWLMEEDELYKDSPLKGLLAQMARSSKGEKKGKWVNSRPCWTLP